MHPLSIRRLLLQRLPLILSLQALGVSIPQVWVLCVEDGLGGFVPRQDLPVCFDFEIAKSYEKELTSRSGRVHHAIPFKAQAGGLLG